MSAGVAASFPPEELAGPVWLHLDDFISRLSQDLQPGELIHGGQFSLFEAMSAIEIGNPKMDPGSLHNKQIRLLDESAPLRLSNSDTLRIADQLLAQEASWYAGNTLAQTVFTCLYLLHPERLEHNYVLRALCKAVRATCSIVRELVQTGAVTREEDFLVHSTGMQLPSLPHDGAAPIVSSLTAAEERIATAERLESSSHASSRQQQEDDSCWPGLRCRVSYRRSLIQALYKLQGASYADLEAAQKYLHNAISELAQMLKTCTADNTIDDYSVGFDLEANRGELGPVPPRIVTPIPMHKVWTQMQSMLNHLLYICQLPKVDTWEGLQTYLRVFATFKAGPVARSAMHVAVTKASGTGASWGPTREMMCTATGMPPHASGLPQEVEAFLEQAVIVAREWCQAMCYNHARVGRSLRQRSTNWAHLHAHATTADTHLIRDTSLHDLGWDWPSGPGSQVLLGTWVERESALVQSQILLLGFETEVYAPPDYFMLYWYCDFLFGIVTLTSQQLLQAYPRPTSQAQGSVKPSSAHTRVKKAHVGKGKAPAIKPDPAHAQYQRLCSTTIELAEKSEAHRTACQGCAWLAVGVDLLGLLPRHAPVFNTLRHRFEQRFAFCHRLPAPHALSYDQLAQVLQSVEGQAVDVFRMAQKSFTARIHELNHPSPGPQQALSQLALKKVLMKNLVALALLIKVSNDSNEKAALQVSWDFLQHPFIPVVGLKSGA